VTESREHWYRAVGNDLRIALRGLRRAPGFAVAAVLTLALGIGATTSVFSVAYGVLLAPLPVRDAQRVVVLWGRNPNKQPEHFALSGPEYTAFTHETRTFSAVAAVEYHGASPSYLHLGDTVVTVRAALVTGPFFDVLGAHPIVGRLLRPEDDLHIVPTPLVLGERMWRTQFASDPSIVGRVTQLGLSRVKVVGVVAGGFDYPRGADMWLSYRSRFPATDTLPGFHDIIARLAPGATVAATRQELAAFFARPDEPHSGARALSGQDVQAMVEPIADVITGDVRPVLRVVVAAVLLLLLVTCVNVANLVLVRALARRREFAVRAALGGGRRRIAQQVLAESAMLSLFGGALGIGCAWYAVHAFAHFAPLQLPRGHEITMYAPVLAGALALCAGVTLLFGCVPAFATNRLSLADSLRERRSGDASPIAGRVRTLLVGVQVAVAVAVLVAAAIVARSFDALAHDHLGFRADHVIVARIAQTATVGDAAAWSSMLQAAIQRIRAVAGVTHATGLTSAPFGVVGNDLAYELPDDPRGAKERPFADFLGADADYFNTLGIALRKGRVFNQADRIGSSRVAIVDELLAHQAWADKDPIGRQIGVGPLAYHVIGVVAPTRYRDLLAPRATLYMPYAQATFKNGDFLTPYMVAVRSPLDPARLIPQLFAAVHETDGRLFLADAAPMTERIDASLATERLNALLLAGFGVAILALTGVGLYTIAATFVRYREFEIGVRVALGATPREVLRLVARQGMSVIIAGVAVGVLIALGGGAILDTVIYGASSKDPLAFAAAIVAVAFVGAVAFFIPGRRAASANPSDVLRNG
jgi:putative ABC transport system permease protein